MRGDPANYIPGAEFCTPFGTVRRRHAASIILARATAGNHVATSPAPSRQHHRIIIAALPIDQPPP
jgi:hypothetical protein